MNILAVDTAGKTAGVALLQDDRLLYECYLDAGMTHSETILPLIDNCLKFCHLTCADIDVYGVNAGPGLACQLVDIFLNTEFEGGRHEKRVAKLMAIENR